MMESTVGGGRRLELGAGLSLPGDAAQEPDRRNRGAGHAHRAPGGRAVAVEYARGGRLRSAAAASEIVLSAGAYGSPHLLMLSGIGDPEELRAAGIEPVHALPGGRSRPRRSSGGDQRVRTCRRRGPDAAFARRPRGAGGMALVRERLGPFGLYRHRGQHLRPLERRSRPAGHADDVPAVEWRCAAVGAGLQRKPVSKLSVRTGYLPLKSRGWVKLRSADPRDPPRIFLNMFAAPGDLDGMVRSLRLSRQIYAQSPLRELIARENLPGDELQSDAALAEHVRRHATHRAHPACSCRHGQRRGRGGRCRAARARDRRAAVRRTPRSCPPCPAAISNLPIMMIGEKAADLIRT